MRMVNGEKVYANDAGHEIVFRGGQWVPFTAGGAPAAPPDQSGQGEEEEQPGLVARANRALSGYAERAGSMINPTVGKVAGAVTGAVLPADNAQLAIDAAMLGLYGTGLGEVGTAAKLGSKALEWLPEFVRPAARFAAREGISTGAGALGGATEGKAGEGAEEGAFQQLGSEVLSGVFHGGARTLGRFDAKRIGKWVSDKLPALGDLNTVEDIDTMLRGDRGVDRLASQRNLVHADISRQLQGAPVAVHPPAGVKVTNPPNWSKATFDDINKFIEQVNDRGYDLAGDPTSRNKGKFYRAAAKSLRQDTAHALDQVNPDWGARYLRVNRQLGRVKELKRLFNESFDKRTGEYSMPLLQKNLAFGDDSGGFRDSLARHFGPGDRDSLIHTAFRGKEAGKFDVPGHMLPAHAYMHPRGMHGVLQMPRPAYHAGDVPLDLGRGRTLALALAHGPQAFLRFLEHLDQSSDEGATAPETAGAATAPSAAPSAGAGAPPATAPASSGTPPHPPVNPVRTWQKDGGYIVQGTDGSYYQLPAGATQWQPLTPSAR